MTKNIILHRRYIVIIIKLFLQLFKFLYKSTNEKQIIDTAITNYEAISKR